MTTFPTGCDICDTQGPHLPYQQTWYQAHRDLHPAWEALRASVAEEWEQLKAAAAPIVEAIERAQRDTQDDYTLAGPGQEPR